jgi:anti-sigma regulatory factor (Ser/Thr protein kinase)
VPTTPPTANSPELELTLQPDAGALADARGRLRDWLRGHGAREALVRDVLLAVNEALTNSIEHGYLDRQPGSVHCRAALGPEGTIEFVVRDEGRWRPPTDQAEPAGMRGRGLPLIRALAEELTLSTDRTGTTVRIRFSR